MQHRIAFISHTQHGPHTAQVARDTGVSQRAARLGFGLKRNPASVGGSLELRVNTRIGRLRVLMEAFSTQIEVERVRVMPIRKRLRAAAPVAVDVRVQPGPGVVHEKTVFPRNDAALPRHARKSNECARINMRELTESAFLKALLAQIH